MHCLIYDGVMHYPLILFRFRSIWKQFTKKKSEQRFRMTALKIHKFFLWIVRPFHSHSQTNQIRYPFITFSMAHSSANVIMFANVRQLAFWRPHQDLRYFD